MSSITPYNKYKVNDLTGSKQPYVSSTTEFGYFGNLGSVLNCNSMPTNLLTNNGIATVDASGLHILNAGIYTLKVSVDCTVTSMTSNNDGIIYFNFGTNKLTNVAYGNVSGSFGGSQLNKMFSFGSNAQGYPGIIAWLTNSNTEGTNPTASKYLVSNNQLLWGYYCNNNTTNGPLDSGICTTKITFNISQPTTIYFNIGCIDNNLSNNYQLTMGTSYFTLDLISNISPTNLIYTLQTAGLPASASWKSIASDSTGKYLVAVINSNTGKIYRSSDYGVNWSPLNTGINGFWSSIASSSDGTHLAAVIEYKNIYTSTDSGQSWTPRATTITNQDWYSIASSSDGSKLAAVSNSFSIWTSTDYGANWTPRASNQYWNCITSDSTGQYLAATSNYGQPGNGNAYLWTSKDYGATWSNNNNSADRRNWSSIASSSDGSKLAAVVAGGYIYTSTDYGANWTPRATSLNWVSIASSSDGSRLVAVVAGGYIYTSSDSGANWTTNSNSSGSKNWNAIASSSDGTKLAAAVVNGGIYTGVYGY